MNNVVLMGRLTRDPQVKYSQGENPVCVARYTLAVDRRFKRNGEDATDFISCITFGKSGEFAEKYLKKGTKVVVSGRIQTGSYTNKDGNKVYTTDVVVENHEFAESAKAANSGSGNTNSASAAPNPQNASNNAPDGFMDIPEGIEEELPFI